MLYLFYSKYSKSSEQVLQVLTDPTIILISVDSVAVRNILSSKFNKITHIPALLNSTTQSVLYGEDIINSMNPNSISHNSSNSREGHPPTIQRTPLPIQTQTLPTLPTPDDMKRSHTNTIKIDSAPVVEPERDAPRAPVDIKSEMRAMEKEREDFLKTSSSTTDGRPTQLSYRPT